MQNRFRNYKSDRIQEVIVICDRCKSKVAGLQNDMGTSGFYRMANPLWGRYAQSPKEAIVCDECMKKHPQYRTDYNLC